MADMYDDLAELGADMDRLIERGEWTKEAFERLHAAGQAIEERHQHQGRSRLAFLYAQADPAWFE